MVQACRGPVLSGIPPSAAHKETCLACFWLLRIPAAAVLVEEFAALLGGYEIAAMVIGSAHGPRN